MSKTSKKQNLEEQVRRICTYSSEFNEGTMGYSLSEEQFQKIFSLFDEVESTTRKEVIGEIMDFAEVEGTPDGYIRIEKLKRFDKKDFEKAIEKSLDSLRKE